MSGFLQDLRYAFRALAKNPGFTAVAVATLAIGIGANTAMFTAVNAVFLRPLPYSHPDRLTMLWETRPQPGWDHTSVSPGEFEGWRDRNHSYEGLAAIDNRPFILSGSPEPLLVEGAVVSTNFFDLLGSHAAFGRLFTKSDDAPDGPVVLTDGLWKKRFGGDPGVLGKTITLGGTQRTIVGVLPRAFTFDNLEEAGVYVPIQFDRDPKGYSHHHFLNVVGKLRPGVTRERAQAEMSTIAASLEKEYPETNKGDGVRLVSLSDEVNSASRPAVTILFGAVGLVLLIACANIANLQLTRLARRHREVSIRAALGAGRLRLLRQFLAESLALAALGGIAGLLLAVGSVRLLARVSTGLIPATAEISIDGRVLLFAAALSIVTGVLFGLLPALAGSRLNLDRSLRGEATAVVSSSSPRLRSILSALEVALAVVLLAGAGLLLKSFQRLQRVSPGFRTEHVLTASLLRSTAADEPPRRSADFYMALTEQLAAAPGISAAGAVNALPLSGSSYSSSMTFEGEPDPGDQKQSVQFRVMTPGYLGAMGIPVRRGRSFRLSDTAESPLVGMVNEAVVRHFFPARDPIGQRFHFGRGASHQPWVTIVGVVGDVHHRSLAEAPREEVYVPISQRPAREMTVVLRSVGDSAQLAPTLKSVLASIDPDQPVGEIAMLQQLVEHSVAPRRLEMMIFGTFAAAALALACLGIYGILAFFVAARRGEIGLRMALGASSTDVARMVVSQGMRLVAAGLVVGLLGSIAAGRLLSSSLFGVKPADPANLAAVVALLAFVAFFSAYLPARRASRIDPMTALREQ